MIAVDTSTWIAYLQDDGGDGGKDTELPDRALQDRLVLMVPAVLTELLSDPKLASEVAQNLAALPLMDLKPDYWRRAGMLRARVIARKRKARLGDALIAQSFLDARVALLTRDSDFRAFAEAAALHLVVDYPAH